MRLLGSVSSAQEHLQFLEKSLMPLHRPKTLSMYHQQLAYCVMQYIEKDVAMSAIVVEGLIKSWPWTSSSKQVRPRSECQRGDTHCLRTRSTTVRAIA